MLHGSLLTAFQAYKTGCLNNIDKESVENQQGQASILAIRIKKNYLSTTPLRFALKSLILALKESADAKIKAFRTQFRGVGDIKFFMFRLATLYS